MSDEDIEACQLRVMREFDASRRNSCKLLSKDMAAAVDSTLDKLAVDIDEGVAELRRRELVNNPDLVPEDWVENPEDLPELLKTQGE